MAAKPDPDPPTPVVVIRVTRSGGIAGIRRGWFVESTEPDGWPPLVDACPWQEPVEPTGADRFVWRIEVAAPEPTRLAELPETAVRGPWRDLVDRVQELGEPLTRPHPRTRPRTETTDG